MSEHMLMAVNSHPDRDTDAELLIVSLNGTRVLLHLEDDTRLEMDVVELRGVLDKLVSEALTMRLAA